jgi:hypothetical protein
LYSFQTTPRASSHLVAAQLQWLHNPSMGSCGTRSKTPDLFSIVSAREPASPLTASSSRHVLPKYLAGAIKHLSDHEIERLVAAALAEQKRRGRKSEPIVG